MRRRKTPEMKRLEADHGVTVEVFIRRLHDAGYTRTEIARECGISTATLGYWLGVLGAHFELRFATEESTAAVTGSLV
jgi:hypothetical protein